MAVTNWEKIKIRFCDHVKAEVCLEAELIYPAEWLPDFQPRIRAHRCSHAIYCNSENRGSCIWAGTNPLFDPFIE